ncbi:SOS response-associated peptidase [Paenibacillus pasadenensis]|uniref:SOS response-associated peptidase n=1 Tax=Paenibacillus pasadenensis TaxID=217090 RepID=UPI00203B9629|nr:SOS response-associated peptidase [Paenibacillus pasadenensis]MCM3748465.1 SOS response-associated peptidase [Paenibacillus pasadenensis]
MCTRFSLASDLGELKEQFNIERHAEVDAKRYNIAPVQPIPIVRNDRHGVRIMDEARWGLFPFWAKDSVNADAEQLESKPYFKRMLAGGRCIIPCSGLFGWERSEEEDAGKQRADGRQRLPRAMHIQVQGKSVFGMAGLYEEWRTPEGRLARAATIVTVQASGALSQWQERLPVVLDADGMEEWLHPSIRDFSFLRRHMQPLEPFQLRIYPVSNAVDDEQYEAPDCITEIQWA